MQIACPCLLAAAGYTHCKDIQKLPWTSPQPLLLSSYLGDQFDLSLSFNNDFFIVWEFHPIYFDLSSQILPNHPYLLTIQFSFSFKNMKKSSWSPTWLIWLWSMKPAFRMVDGPCEIGKTDIPSPRTCQVWVLCWL